MNLLLSALLSFSLSAHAGVFEALSRGAYVVTNGFCPKYSDADAAQALERAELPCHVAGAPGSPKQVANLAQLSHKIAGGPDDRFFALLAQQHARELSCAGKFASAVGSGKQSLMDNVLTKVRLLREARQAVIEASQNIANNPNVMTKICPLSLDDLQPSSPDYDACRAVVTNRTAYQTILNSIPLAAVPSVRSFLDEYANEKPGAKFDAMDASLKQKAEVAFEGAENFLSGESKKLEDKIASGGGAALDRNTRHALLSDPRVVSKVLEDGGDTVGLQGLACRADAEYGRGADNLNTGAMIASFAFAGAGAVARAGSVAAKIAEGASAARSTGLLSLNATRILQVSAIGVNSLAAYSMIDRACFGGAIKTTAKAQVGAGSCVSAPDVRQIEQDSCVLAVSLSAMGYAATAAGPAKRLIEKLKTGRQGSVSMDTGGAKLFAQGADANVEKVQSSLAKILGRGDDAVAPDIKRLDDALAVDIADSVKSLPAEKQARLLKLLDEAKSAQPFSKKETNGMPYLEHSAGGAVQYTKTENPYLAIQVVSRNHPFSRIVVRHEFSHLSRLDAGDIPAKAAKIHADGVMDRRLGVYREELQAWGDQWSYTRKVYRPEDLPRLKAEYPPVSEADLEFLKSSGTLRIEGKKRILDFSQFGKDDKITSAIVAYYRGDTNDTFVKMVEDAVTKPKAQFTKEMVGNSSYREQQATATRNGKIDKALKRLMWGGTGAAGGAALLYDYLDDSK